MITMCGPFLLLCFCLGVYGNSQIQQTPHVYSTEGGIAEMNCSHSDTNYYSIQWYKQHHGQRLDIILSTYDTVQSSVQFNMTVNKEKLSTTLTINAVELLDCEAVYYCAVRAQ
ncbi:M1-specific T cell receptor beta chain-like [Acipenser oxyrinchus oxyrinchus]|nr:M1-specific T cell receptor beta chain-like [Acipenser oxyrinchus oxyrinchus]